MCRVRDMEYYTYDADEEQQVTQTTPTLRKRRPHPTGIKRPGKDHSNVNNTEYAMMTVNEVTEGQEEMSKVRKKLKTTEEEQEDSSDEVVWQEEDEEVDEELDLEAIIKELESDMEEELDDEEG